MNRTKKLIPVLFAAGAMLLLSSCSAMLDAIYPDRQMISVKVEVSLASHTDTGTPGSYVNVQLTDSFGNLLTSLVATAPASSDATYAYYTFQFTQLKNATYGLYSYYHSSTNVDYPTFGTYGRFYGTIYFTDPSNSTVSLVPVPYNASWDITNLTVVIS